MCRLCRLCAQPETQSEPPPETQSATQSETIGGRACGPGGSTTPPGWIYIYIYANRKSIIFEMAKIYIYANRKF